jgi:hypothetical protein
MPHHVLHCRVFRPQLLRYLPLDLTLSMRVPDVALSTTPLPSLRTFDLFRSFTAACPFPTVELRPARGALHPRGRLPFPPPLSCAPL